MYHVNHALTVSNFQSVVVASPDADVFVCSMCHYKQLIYFGLKEFWIVSGQSKARTVVQIHMLVDSMNDDVIGILPAVHVLTGSDTSSKIGTKVKALKAAETHGNELLCFFGKSELTENMIDDAEKVSFTLCLT